jgi:ribosomal protein S18 acetylase RimI-like enzyme
MLANALHGFQDSGFNEAALHVNVNNPSAVQVYTGLGFISRLRRARYIKQPSTLSKMESRGTNIV